MVSTQHSTLLLRSTARTAANAALGQKRALSLSRNRKERHNASSVSCSGSRLHSPFFHSFTPSTQPRRSFTSSLSSATSEPAATEASEMEHAVISTFDLFSVGIGPSSSHTVGPMRAGVIFVSDLADQNLLDRVHTIKINLYGSLALTGAGHMTPQALLGGLEGDDCETVDPPSVPVRFEEIKSSKKLHLGKNLFKTLGDMGQDATKGKLIDFDYDTDLKWMFGQVLPHHSNGIRMSVFDADGEMLATNDYYSVGGGFVVNGALATPSSSSSSAESGGKTDRAEEDEDATTPALHDGALELSSHPIDWGENIFYKQIRRSDASDGRRAGSSVSSPNLLPQVEAPPSNPTNAASASAQSVPQESEKLTAKPASGPPFPYHNAASLLRQCKTRNLTIAQVVYENELTWNRAEVVHDKLIKIWTTMDECIRAGVENNQTTLPGPLAVRRRAPALYARLLRGLYRGASLLDPAKKVAADGPGIDSPSPQRSSSLDMVTATGSTGRTRMIGSFNHPILPSPARRTNFPAIDYLTCYAIATNEQNAAGGRIVTAPTNGAAGVLPSVLKYCFEFIFDDDPVRDLENFLLTAAAIGMLFKRGATLSAAEGGCMAEVGVATAMAAAGFVAVLGGSPEKVLQASVIGIEHNLGLTCDPLNGQVQIPCIERNALGAVKAVTAAQLALAGDGKHSVSLDDAITAMRETARDMHTSYKETSLGGLATAVRIPVAIPDC
ncbi:related to L-serine dehydratase 1 [Melanopsichium pennsylvanicum]|uniref:Related to L-serine dehydratase 1 n=2 Tax=Melanopsichium pennsylvanicum TaxID=63383 RepID=A0AAJ5C299_9BASI|nr:related to L-serine dehydratase 1 [Melanopsichium pennsylvanicum 4]SNX81343.1 related to L-serine dehydratase 1 [Melanopsichium pennsylvanicum]